MDKSISTIYFSGTGNTQYIARIFNKKMKAKCYSIEEKIDFDEIIKNSDIIVLCYPIYCSRIPRIMREFLVAHKNSFKNKKIVIFCTQRMFSGDGARSLTDLFPENYFEVIYAEHFNMPINIPGIKILKITNGEENRKILINVNKKMNEVCSNISKNIVKKRGFNGFSKILGLSQSTSLPVIESLKKNDVKINKNCIVCGLCVKICPMKNLKIGVGKIEQEGNCTLCYRCVNKCPKKAINIFGSKQIKSQYKGIVPIKK